MSIAHSTISAPVGADAQAGRRWIYLKLYLGRMVDRMDPLIVRLAGALGRQDHVAQWFFIRYVDEGGIHLRLRVQAIEAQADHVRGRVLHICTGLLNQLHDLPPGDYFPMVATPGFDDELQRVMNPHVDVRIAEAAYEPELEKYGGADAMPAAEAVFAQSTLIAADIIAAEAQGLLSRKSLVPSLMAETYAAILPARNAASFWREYAYYWLNGRSPASDDWRATFFQKGEQLTSENVSVTCYQMPAGGPAQRIVARWRRALDEAIQHVGAIPAAEPEVLCFNFAHLMNNRLGVASLEEAYIATLLEQAALGQAAR